MKTPTDSVSKGVAILIMAILIEGLSQRFCAAGTFLVYNLNDSGAGSLRQAIANNHVVGGGNSIVFSNSVSGTITLTSGELLISDNLTIIGPGPGVVDVDGNYPNRTNRVFHIGPGVNVSISGLRIDYGFLPGFNNGAGIYNDHSTLTVSNCDISDNSIGFPGGSGGGGGIYNDGGSAGSATLTVIACTFDGNNPGAGDGGGVYNAGESGGNATLTVSASTFFFNGAAEGGGIYNDGTGSGNAMMTVSASTFYHNTASDGGGIFNDSQSGSLSATLAVSSCTFSDNSGTYADSIYNFGGTLTLGNTILNAGGSGTNIVSGGIQFSYGYNLASDNGGGFLSNAGDQINTAPMLGSFSSLNGGPTPTLIPLPGSPAIDQGRPDVVPNLTRHTDQRGRYRPYDDTGVPNAPGSDGTDIGAVEVSPAHNVVGATSDPAGDSLRYCLLDAQPGDTITFSNTVVGTITLTSGELDISNNITILGPGANVLAVSGNNSNRVFSFFSGVSSVSGLTVRDGLISSTLPGFTGQGGGIFNQATLSLKDCAFTANSAQGSPAFIGTGGSGDGGALYNGGTLTLDRCAFNGNGAVGSTGGNSGSHGVSAGAGGRGSGGAVFNDTAASLTLNNCTFSGNAAFGGTGGAGGSSAGGNGGAACGAVFNQGTLTMTSGTLSSNSATGGFPGTGTPGGATGAVLGALTAAGGTTAVRNTIVAGDTGGDVNGAFSSGGYNLIGSTSGSSGFGATGDQLNVSPLLGPLQNNGGPTPTMALLFGSPAIDKGNSFGLTTDQRGEPRPFDWPLVSNATGGDGSDIGAFERGRPRLNIQQSGTNAVLSWPSYYGNGEFSLQSSTNLSLSNSWVVVPGTPAVLGTQYLQTNGPVAGNKFFRLKSN